MQDLKNTQYFKVEKEPQMKVSDVIDVVYHALSEKGYNPVNQSWVILCQEILPTSPAIGMQEA